MSWTSPARPRIALAPLVGLGLAWLGLVLLGTACSPADTGPAPIVQDSAGVELVRHGRLADYGRPVHAAEYLLILDAEDGPPETGFEEVAGVELLDDGTVAVLDRRAAEVRVYSPAGSFMRRVGRRGSGPGELSGDLTVALVGVGAGRLLLPDAINRTVSVFGRDGGLAESYRWDILREYIPEWRAASDSTVAVHLWSASRPWQVLAHRAPAGAWLDTLAVFPARPPTNPLDQRFPVWPDMVVWSTREPAEVVAGWMSEPWVTLFRRGVPVRRISWERDDAPLTAEQHNVLFDIVARTIDPTETPPDLRAQVRLPERLPAAADIEVAEDLILVQRVRPVETLDQRVTYANRGSDRLRRPAVGRVQLRGRLPGRAGPGRRGRCLRHSRRHHPGRARGQPRGPAALRGPTADHPSGRALSPSIRARLSPDAPRAPAARNPDCG